MGKEAKHTTEMDTTIAEQLQSAVDVFYLLNCAFLVFFMQCGFAMLEAGSVRSKNTRSILFKNLLDACVGAVVWWSFGYSLAYDPGNAFMGGLTPSAFSHGIPGHEAGGVAYASWMFQYVFAATAATIVSGAMAERTSVVAYLLYTTVLTGFVYPVVVHWVWSSQGWLSAFNPDAPLKVIDFAGSGVVHMTGGVTALVGAVVVGPRKGRFAAPGDFVGHSSVLQTLGTFILWFGWYGFNCGSTLGITAHLYARDAARVAATTTMAAASGGLTQTFVVRATSKVWSPTQTCNGILAGLVGITSGCSVTHPYHALVIGSLGALASTFASKALVVCRVDDPLDAFPIHGVAGAWGVIAAGLFAVPAYAYNGSCGAFYGCHEAVVAALVAVASILAWCVVLSLLMFLTLRKLRLLRITEAEEEQGLDLSKHGGNAYAM